MKTHYTLLFLLTIVILAGCSEDEVTSRDYPRLNTLNVTNISENGATFRAEIIYRGDFEIHESGFVWVDHEYPSLDNDAESVPSEEIKSNKFSAQINTTLTSGKTYYVRPFVITDNYRVYGKQVVFSVH